MTLAQLLDKYRILLKDFWPEAIVIAKDAGGNEWLNDWKQANWELIVEGGLGLGSSVFLVPYGEGADFYGASSRIFRPEAIPTHAVCGRPIAGVIDMLTDQPAVFPAKGVMMECFVTVRDGWYYEEPPFDAVLFLDDNTERVLAINSVEFFLGNPME